ncbi:IS110 family transposase [Flavobacterium tructae]|uniref:IS110 family transposase n=1 Tax=Flavobacterium tructae TaxID=1114873 RepID=UPI00255208E9|nr:IS110 family transposase [Flavobacterium tructae]MDL2145137.1 IS110 family transposase [Flavobacterium tructae]
MIYEVYPVGLNPFAITHLSIESTGVYWKPVFNILSDEFEILLVNARHLKNIPGHKTDKKDSRWLAKLLFSGLLKASFVPPNTIRDLRDLTRYRKKLVQNATAERNRFERVIQDANFKLSNVITDLFGKTGILIITALLQGNNNFEELLALCHGSIKMKKDILKEALKGKLTDHHKFMLETIRLSIENINYRIAKIDRETALLCNQYSTEIDLLKTIPGVNSISAASMIAEIGVDMDKFPTVHHLASWAGVCPGNNESAGKMSSSRITSGNQHLKLMLIECAWSATGVKDCYLRKKYESLLVRRGKKRVLVAVGHKMLTAAYFMIKYKVPYLELGYDYIDSRRKQNQVQSYIDKLKKLGIEVEITQAL